jgi:acyl-CoA thioesterase-1
MWSVARRGAKLSAAVLAAELAGAYLWPAPEQEEFDASGSYGDPALPTLTLGAIGDSTTTGPGLRGPEEIWLVQFAQRLTERFCVRIHSYASGGATAHAVERYQLPRLVELAPDLAFVVVGANDALRGVPVRLFERRLDRIASAVAGSGSTLVLSGVGDLGSIPRLLPPSDRLMAAHGRRYDRAHDRVAERHGAIKVDMWTGVSEVFRSDPDAFSPDRFHPTAVGHAAWADATYRAVAHLVDGPAV